MCYLYRRRPARTIPRLVAILLIAAAAGDFAWYYTRRQAPLPAQVLVDVSPSVMRFLDSIQTCIGRFSFDHEVAYFADSTSPKPSPGQRTDITSALLRADARGSGAIVIFSDGNHNCGPSLHQLRRMRTPVTVVAVGEDSLHDVAIDEVRYPDYVYQGDTIRITARISSRGGPPGRAEVCLRRPDGAVLARTRVRVGGMAMLTDAEFRIVAQDSGRSAYRIEAVPHAAESDPHNNHADFVLQVLPAKLRILLYSGHLSFNATTLARAVDACEQYELTALTRITSGRYLDLTTHVPRTSPPRWDGFQVLILDNLDRDVLPRGALALHLRSGGGIIYTGSLPDVPTAEEEVSALTTAGRPVAGSFRPEVKRFLAPLHPGMDLPPFRAVNRVVRVRPSATVIAASGTVPLLLIDTILGGRVAHLNALDLGTWDMACQGARGTGMLSPILSNLIRIVSPWGNRPRLILSSRDSRYGVREEIEFVVRAYDRSFAAAGGECFITDGSTVLACYETEPGVYRASHYADTAGNRRFSAYGVFGGDSVSSAPLAIAIDARTTEPREAIDHEALRLIARQTGGAYYALQDLDPRFAPVRRSTSDRRRFDLDVPIVYALAFCALAGDWYLRKREGGT